MRQPVGRERGGGGRGEGIKGRGGNGGRQRNKERGRQRKGGRIPHAWCTSDEASIGHRHLPEAAVPLSGSLPTDS